MREKYRFRKWLFNKVLKPIWIINGDEELGLRILGTNLWYYKHPTPMIAETGCSKGTWKTTRKREFGEVVLSAIDKTTINPPKKAGMSDVLHSEARGPKFVESARIMIRQKGACSSSVYILCALCPFSSSTSGLPAHCNGAGFRGESTLEDPLAVESARQYLHDCGEEASIP